MSSQEPSHSPRDRESELGRQLLWSSRSGAGSAAAASSSAWRQVLNFAIHIVYPVLMSPLLIGVFYMCAAWRLAAPSMGSACFAQSDKKSAMSGRTLFALTGGLFKACPSATRNSDHALLLFIVGLSLLFAMCAPAFNIFATDPDEVPGDSAFGPATIIGYIVTAYVFLWIGLEFSSYSRAEKAAERASKDRSHASRSAVMKHREAVAFIAKFPDIEYRVTPLWCIAIGIVASGVECVLFKIYARHFSGAIARFRNLDNQWSALTYATAFFLLTATNVMCWFGLYLLKEQLHHLGVFEAQAQLTVNEASVARWSVAWQHLLQDMNRSPMVSSIAPACSVLLFVEVAISLMFGVLFNLFRDRQALRDMLPIAIFVGSHSALLLTGYLYTIVQTQNVIERQHKAISALQNLVQAEVDGAALDADDQLLPVLRAKVRVLQSLDRFLLIADPKPKILGISVDAFRWAIINCSLVTINVSFLLLYLVFCYPNQQQHYDNSPGGL